MVLYDSNFGNTKKLAEAIAVALGKEARAVPVAGLGAKELEGIDLLVAGCPIIGWRPSEKMGRFLAALKKGELEGVKAAAFDTRVKLFIHGDAAGKVSRRLAEAGAEIVAGPQPFYVGGRDGPLLEGELARAALWAKSLSDGLQSGRRPA